MTENQQANMTEREEFLTNLMRMAAHDLNNILSPILGYPELLMECFSEGSQEQEDLVEIQDLANRAIALIKDVQQLIRPELTEARPCSLVSSIRTALSESSLTKEMKHRVDVVHVGLLLEDTTPDILSARHVIAALLKNLFVACLYVTKDDGKLAVSTRSVDQQVTLKVDCQVSALKEDEVDRIVEPFFLRKRYSTKLTGLELTVVQELIRQHKGTFSWALRGEALTLTLNFPSAQ